jgi:hypothetical protein
VTTRCGPKTAPPIAPTFRRSGQTFPRVAADLSPAVLVTLEVVAVNAILGRGISASRWSGSPTLAFRRAPRVGVAADDRRGVYSIYVLYGDRPATRPSGRRAEVNFGGAVAFTYHDASHRFRLVLRIKYRVRGPPARHGDSGFGTKTAHAASNPVSIKYETLLADRAAERKALPEPAVAVAQ